MEKHILLKKLNKKNYSKIMKIRNYFIYTLKIQFPGYNFRSVLLSIPNKELSIDGDII